MGLFKNELTPIAVQVLGLLFAIWAGNRFAKKGDR